MDAINNTALSCALGLATFILFYLSDYAYATPEIRKGMNGTEVIKLLGPPSDRVEREAFREEEWLFPAITVKFREGKVISWHQHSSSLNQHKLSVEEASSRSNSAPPTKQPNFIVEEVLTEIMNEAPDKDDGANAPTPLPGAPLNPVPEMVQ